MNDCINKNKIGYIYAHICKKGKKRVYIGQTIQNPEIRWGKNGKNYSECLFSKAIKKYGWNNFDHIILYKGCPALLNYLEEYYINKYNSFNDGYNTIYKGQRKTHKDWELELYE